MCTDILLYLYLKVSGQYYFNPTGFERCIHSLDGSAHTIKGFAFSKHVEQDCAAQGAKLYPSVSEVDGQFVLENSDVVLRLSSAGAVVSLVDKRLKSSSSNDSTNGREVIAVGGLGNNLMLYEDIPFYWDAWDTMPYHLMQGRSINALAPHSLLAKPSDRCTTTTTDASILLSTGKSGGSNAAGVKFVHRLWGGHADSVITQVIQLTEGSPVVEFITEVDWRENRKILKVEFPVAIRSAFASYEIQYGLQQRPTHVNTPFDAAMFEVCGHRFSDLSEEGYGVALLNDGKYGSSCRGSTMCISLLRAPKAPDANCDMGIHSFKYALLPHKGSSLLDSHIVQEAASFNSPLKGPYPANSDTEIRSVKPTADHCDLLFSGMVTVPYESSLILDALKMAEDSDDVILRLYEFVGSRGVSKIQLAPYLGIKVHKIVVCSSSEEEISPVELSDTWSFMLEYAPFQIISLKVMILGDCA